MSLECDLSSGRHATATTAVNSGFHHGRMKGDCKIVDNDQHHESGIMIISRRCVPRLLSPFQKRISPIKLTKYLTLDSLNIY